MTSTPFRDTARDVYVRCGNDFARMQVDSDSARSHAWWRNVVNQGAWKTAGSGRVGPPTPEAIPGIAKLFRTTEDQVRAMIAADWYNVGDGSGWSAQAQRVAATVESLGDGDRDIVESIASRLAK